MRKANLSRSDIGTIRELLAVAVSGANGTPDAMSNGWDAPMHRAYLIAWQDALSVLGLDVDNLAIQTVRLPNGKYDFAVQCDTTKL
jgi:hypothetical protein